MDDRPLTQMRLPPPRRRLRRPGMLYVTSSQPAKDTHTQSKADLSGVGTLHSHTYPLIRLFLEKKLRLKNWQA